MRENFNAEYLEQKFTIKKKKSLFSFLIVNIVVVYIEGKIQKADKIIVSKIWQNLLFLSILNLIWFDIKEF